MKFEISWTYGGTTIVNAPDGESAKDAFHDLDHSALLAQAYAKADDEGLDVVSVDKVPS